MSLRTLWLHSVKESWWRRRSNCYGTFWLCKITPRSDKICFALEAKKPPLTGPGGYYLWAATWLSCRSVPSSLWQPNESKVLLAVSSDGFPLNEGRYHPSAWKLLTLSLFIISQPSLLLSGSCLLPSCSFFHSHPQSCLPSSLQSVYYNSLNL